MKTVKLIIAALALAYAGGAMGQTATPHATKRQVKQQARIQEGVRSGELTRKEAAGLQMQQAKIQHDKKVAKSDGVVTPAERRKLHRQQKRANRAIYTQKHDAQSR